MKNLFNSLRGNIRGTFARIAELPRSKGQRLIGAPTAHSNGYYKLRKEGYVDLSISDLREVKKLLRDGWQIVPPSSK